MNMLPSNSVPLLLDPYTDFQRPPPLRIISIVAAALKGAKEPVTAAKEWFKDWFSARKDWMTLYANTEPTTDPTITTLRSVNARRSRSLLY